jgi:hypothetical protein
VRLRFSLVYSSKSDPFLVFPRLRSTAESGRKISVYMGTYLVCFLRQLSHPLLCTVLTYTHSSPFAFTFQLSPMPSLGTRRNQIKTDGTTIYDNVLDMLQKSESTNLGSHEFGETFDRKFDSSTAAST